MRINQLIEILKTADQNTNLFLERYNFIDTCFSPYGYVTFKFGSDFLNTAVALCEAQIKNLNRKDNIIKNEETKMKATKKPVKKAVNKPAAKKPVAKKKK